MSLPLRTLAGLFIPRWKESTWRIKQTRPIFSSGLFWPSFLASLHRRCRAFAPAFRCRSLANKFVQLCVLHPPRHTWACSVVSLHCTGEDDTILIFSGSIDIRQTWLYDLPLWMHIKMLQHYKFNSVDLAFELQYCKYLSKGGRLSGCKAVTKQVFHMFFCPWFSPYIWERERELRRETRACVPSKDAVTRNVHRRSVR